MRSAACDDGAAELECTQQAAAGRRLQLFAHHARERVDRVCGARLADAELLQQWQPVRDQHAAARGRRVRIELLAAEARSHGSPADDAVLVEIALRKAAAALADVLDHPGAELTRVQLLRPAFGQ